MSNNDWVQQGTPRNEEWAAEDDYGVPVEPEEWDDYASDQTVAVPAAPAAEPEVPVAGSEPAARSAVPDIPEAPEPASADAEASAPAEAGPADLSAAQAPTDEAPVGEGIVETPVEEAPVEEAPAVEAPVDEAPAVEAPVDEGPIAESPVEVAADEADESPAEESADTAVVAAAVAGTGAAMHGLYRTGEDAEHTQVIADVDQQRLADELAEEERIAHEVRAAQEARAQRLGVVPTSDANAVRDAAPARPRGVGHFASFGLFVLRIVTALIAGVVGYQILSDVEATTEFLGQTLIPEPEIVAWSVGFGLAGIAVFLVIGLAVRVMGTLLAAVACCSLAFIRWGNFSPFVDGMEGFLGDTDLLLAAVGILFLSIGGGRWGVDGAFVKARQNAREARH